MTLRHHLTCNWCLDREFGKGEDVTQRKVGGVLGGLGPLATAYFLQQIVMATDAQTDQDHVDLIITQRSSTPDRTAAILGQGPSPADSLNRDISILIGAGAEFITAPCNSSVVFLEHVNEQFGIPFLSIIEETVKAARGKYPDATKLALMATAGTAKAGLYHRAAEENGFTVVDPTSQEQEAITAIIYDQVKANKPIDQEQFFDVCDGLMSRGAEVLITGCTELSVVVEKVGLQGRPIVDSLKSLAQATVRQAGGRVLADN